MKQPSLSQAPEKSFFQKLISAVKFVFSATLGVPCFLAAKLFLVPLDAVAAGLLIAHTHFYKTFLGKKQAIAEPIYAAFKRSVDRLDNNVTEFCLFAFTQTAKLPQRVAEMVDKADAYRMKKEEGEKVAESVPSLSLPAVPAESYLAASHTSSEKKPANSEKPVIVSAPAAPTPAVSAPASPAAPPPAGSPAPSVPRVGRSGKKRSDRGHGNIAGG